MNSLIVNRYLLIVKGLERLNEKKYSISG